MAAMKYLRGETPWGTAYEVHHKGKVYATSANGTGWHGPAWARWALVWAKLRGKVEDKPDEWRDLMDKMDPALRARLPRPYL